MSIFIVPNLKFFSGNLTGKYYKWENKISFSLNLPVKKEIWQVKLVEENLFLYHRIKRLINWTQGAFIQNWLLVLNKIDK